MTNETKGQPCGGCPQIRFTFETHKPYCIKRGIYIDEQTVPCEELASAKQPVDKAGTLKDAIQQLRITRSNLDSMMENLCKLSLSNIASDLRVHIAKELDEVLDKLNDVQEQKCQTK